MVEGSDFPVSLRNQRRLSAVVIPMHIGEVARLEDNFWLWDHAAFAPGVLSNDERPALIVSFNNEKGRVAEAELRTAYEATTYVRQCFSGIEFLYLDLQGDNDVYIRDYSQRPPSEGFKAGPNNQFFETINRLRHLEGYLFLMETDCVPVRSGWLRELCCMVRQPRRFWIMGSAYRGVAHLDNDFARHINGNAIYAVGDDSFQDFVADIWRPRLRHVASQHDPRIAYDIFLEVMLTNGMHSKREYEWRLFQETAHLWIYTDFIQNRSSDADSRFFESYDLKGFLVEHPNTYILHGAVFSRAVSLLKLSGKEVAPANLGVGLTPSKTPSTRPDLSQKRGESIWSFVDSVRENERHLRDMEHLITALRREVVHLRGSFRPRADPRSVAGPQTAEPAAVATHHDWRDDLILDC